MNIHPIHSGRQLRSLIKSTGELELSLEMVATPDPGPDQLIVRIEAAPINPTDLGVLFGAADLDTLTSVGSPDHPRIIGRIPAERLSAMHSRMDLSLAPGVEGAGIVVRAGASPRAQTFQGATVSMVGSGMYSQYRCVDVDACMVLPDGTPPSAAGSLFVNPLTALAMLETMRSEGHTALVHTAAASSLGQILNKLCLKDGIGLVNIVRKKSQADLLTSMGAIHVCNSESPDFAAELTHALIETGATLAFDAIGGGKLASQILSSMEAALAQGQKVFRRYGTTIHKQVYLYGGLGRGPTELYRNYGMAWGIGGWLVFPALEKLGPAVTERLKHRVIDERDSVFATQYRAEISLTEALRLDLMTAYAKAATGEKYLINPNKQA